MFTIDGKRKYLTHGVRDRFLAVANEHERGEVRTPLPWHRLSWVSELELPADKIDLPAKSIVFQTPKQCEGVDPRGGACLEVGF